jgi:hypothetical protein
VRTSRQSGPITITAKAPGLTDATTILQATTVPEPIELH